MDFKIYFICNSEKHSPPSKSTPKPNPPVLPYSTKICIALPSISFLDLLCIPLKLLLSKLSSSPRQIRCKNCLRFILPKTVWKPLTMSSSHRSNTPSFLFWSWSPSTKQATRMTTEGPLSSILFLLPKRLNWETVSLDSYWNAFMYGADGSPSTLKARNYRFLKLPMKD